MYNLPYFKEHDPAAVLAFVKEHPFATVIGCGGGGRPVATQLPLLVEERNDRLFLSGHLMRKMDHHLAFEQNPSVLCLFTGAHTYVSASWYANPHQASTWNYSSVHLRGRLRFLDEAGLVDVLQRTSLHFEGSNTASPTVFNNLPADYTARLMKAIVAFEIEVEEIENVFKLSQNRDRESYGHIIEKLKGLDADAQSVAAAMQEWEQRLFPEA